LYRFNAYRNDDGQLNLNVNKVNPDNDWDEGYGAAFSNSLFLLSSGRSFLFQAFFPTT
jgi:hypothetical protein